MTKRRFLLVDDDQDMLTVLSGFLGSLGECDTVGSGDEAVSALDRSLDGDRPYDAVFLDIMMPGMDGHETAARLRQAEKQHGVPPTRAFKLIMISSLDDTKNVCRSFFHEGCADAYLPKPLDHAKLMAELRGLKLTD